MNFQCKEFWIVWNLLQNLFYSWKQNTDHPISICSQHFSLKLDDIWDFKKISNEHYRGILAPSETGKCVDPSDFFSNFFGDKVGLFLVLFLLLLLFLGNLLLHLITQDEISNLEMLNWK